MARYKRWFGPIAAGLVVALAHFFGVLQPIDDGLSATRARLIQREPTHTIAVVEIDSKSLRAAGEWPWSRDRYAKVIANLRAAGARIIGFDVDFSARSSPADDAALRAQIEAYAGDVVLPTFVQHNGGERTSPLAALAKDAVFGNVNVPIDNDGKARRYMRGVAQDGAHYSSMASILADAPYGDTSTFLLDYGVRVDQIDRLSFKDVLANRFDPRLVQNKAVLIGSTALELGDKFSTPVQPVMQGVYVHALAYENMRQGRTLWEVNGFIALGCAAAALIFLWPRRRVEQLKAIAVRHGFVLIAALIAPYVVQTFLPISIDTAAVIAAQALCFWATLHLELGRRAREIANQREAHLRHVALHDPETQLPNRRAMLADLGKRLRGPTAPKTLIVAAVGIDRFSQVRGAIGYNEASELVQKLAQRLSDWGGGAPVYHLSTSILGIAIEVDSAAEARAGWEKRLATLNTAVEMDAGHEIDASVRTGCAIWRASGEHPAEHLLEHATLALDLARRESRRNLFYTPKDHDTRTQLRLFSSVGKGLARDEFNVVYQPKVNARSGVLVGAEALLRWTHATQGEISAERFIPVAEQTGAIEPLTRWTLRRAIEDQARLRAEGIDVTLSVNMSGRLLCDEAFCADAISEIQRAGAHICFEITETAVIQDPELAMEMLASLRSAGITISIDDYGTGLSSLAYLKQIPAQELKLDKSLMLGIETHARERLIVKSTIDLAHSVGMSVVAEGVEDDLVLHMLASMGCDAIQGYVVSRPLAADAFVAFARQNNIANADERFLAPSEGAA